MLKSVKTKRKIQILKHSIIVAFKLLKSAIAFTKKHGLEAKQTKLHISQHSIKGDIVRSPFDIFLKNQKPKCSPCQHVLMYIIICWNFWANILEKKRREWIYYYCKSQCQKFSKVSVFPNESVHKSVAASFLTSTRPTLNLAVTKSNYCYSYSR